MGAPAVTLQVVLDTSTLVTVLQFRERYLGWLRRACEYGHRRPLVCRATLTELIRFVAYPKFRQERGDIAELLADFVPCTESAADPDMPADRPACRDSDDQVFLDLAIAVRADALVTGDRGLLGQAATAPESILPPVALRRRFRLG